MRLGPAIAAIAAGVLVVAAVRAFERPFRVYPSLEPYDIVTLPPDYQEKAEWVFGRLMYPQHPNSRFGRYRWGGGPSNWLEGGTSWTQDYPRADRLFAQAVRRLTRVHVRSVEQPVNPDDLEDLFDWPWLCAGEMGDWKLTGHRQRICASTCCAAASSCSTISGARRNGIASTRACGWCFPTVPWWRSATQDAIFHAVYNLDERYQIPGQWALRRGTTYREDGAVPHWRGIYDDHGRLMVAMCFNNDTGDAWEWADDPRYPEKYSALGIRLGVNFVVYSMTH